MSNSIVAAIYRYVIDDVVRNVQADFEGHGVDTSVLEELQRSWEAKIVQSRVASFPGEDAAYDQGMRMNQADGYSYNAPEPTINSAASLASIINNPENMAPSAASLASLAQSGRGQLLEDDEEPLSGKLPEDMRHYAHHYRNIPQNDGASDTPEKSKDAMEIWKQLRDERRRIAQLDGASDDEAHANGTSGSAGAPASSDARVEAPEDAINSDLDDSDEDEGDEDAEEIEHIVLCQYEKVTRSKNKWKCVLRDGIMLLNGRDYLFQKANGDFEW
ncbi:transcription factor IIA subunit alpha [Coemansia sp. RSA 989]|nr:transcription factor IIA, alpha/beta subunit-domain-containing protein [Coemansia mojavensis]KAJ1738286.1 transcription factor IIA subunit alpha [Coemansia sp. RSA 1086]KAJ1750521.1 transcription factor IIA subunit alpha [Coemansia sp. RSA 1821]KAJ1860713.1 transcription factor IIA subunit alpha [Coemansia sp. RSA 989]KAJ1868871.1 transcription factor IIA subunit alpha [Coemansia sp. RSA 990]KAJ2653254.1 transcription factor IIA subunit alpha [Coemansia sp. RSA 1250]KAJ2674514.1 transcript